MNYRLRFGSYDLPSTLLPADMSGGQDAGEVTLLREPGSAIVAPVAQARPLAVRGQLHGATPSAYFAKRDALFAAVLGRTDVLWFGRDDRFYKDAYVSAHGEADPVDGRLWGSIGTISMTFRAAKYPQAFGTATYAPVLSAPALNSGGAVPILYSAVQGDAPTAPTWTLTIGTAGAGPLLLQATNTDTSGVTQTDICQIQRPDGANFGAGDQIVLDRLTGVGTYNGIAVLGLYDRRIPRIRPGTNLIRCYSLAASGAASLSSLACSYVGRWN